MSTGIVNWDQVEPSRGGDGEKQQVDYKTLESGGKPNRIRPVYKPMLVYKYYVQDDKRTRSAIVADPDTCSVKEKHADLKPSLRYAINILDRDDGDKLKVYEGPPTVFRALRQWFEATGKTPGGEKGGDFVISKEGKGLQTRYTCQFVEPTPFTEEQIEMIKSKKIYDLPKIYAPHPPDVIEKLLYGGDEEGGSQSAPASASTSSSENSFNNEESDTQSATQSAAQSSGDDAGTEW